ncbi:uncharacterized protein EDB91DRAFT_1084634 [Suillus paluster]|uniref:uncharacterized protein n=1 Tax=Suillus paluster TaxID=48578 RepID=UPI001B85E8F6|nr:uncharacterized protein EDB91DRAFT_1084634 [Suillus paluster]KAG1732902.1 hypothetical protein EDB91DRAFT_1084634 [Suillus paluster]
MRTSAMQPQGKYRIQNVMYSELFLHMTDDCRVVGSETAGGDIFEVIMVNPMECLVLIRHVSRGFFIVVNENGELVGRTDTQEFAVWGETDIPDDSYIVFVKGMKQEWVPDRQRYPIQIIVAPSIDPTTPDFISRCWRFVKAE